MIKLLLFLLIAFSSVFGMEYSNSNLGTGEEKTIAAENHFSKLPDNIIIKEVIPYLLNPDFTQELSSPIINQIQPCVYSSEYRSQVQFLKQHAVLRLIDQRFRKICETYIKLSDCYKFGLVSAIENVDIDYLKQFVAAGGDLIKIKIACPYELPGFIKGISYLSLLQYTISTYRPWKLLGWQEQGEFTTPITLDYETNCIDPVLEYLLEHGADVNKLDKNGFTPLHNAVESRYTFLVKSLLAKKPLMLLDNERKTALDKARERKLQPITSLLEDYVGQC